MGIVHDWAATLELHLRHNQTRFDFAKLFGNLFNEWIASGDSVTAAPTQNPDGHPETFVEVGRKELLEQKGRLQEIIFTALDIDVNAIGSYLDGLFSSDEAASALKQVRQELDSYGASLFKRDFTSADVLWAIQSLLSSSLMSEEKRATLKDFANNTLVLHELASVLNMRIANLGAWAWPAEGVAVEMRRYLNGKYRAHTDPDIVDGILLEMLGVLWQVALKRILKTVFSSAAWKPSLPPPPKNALLRQLRFIGPQSAGNNIEEYRKTIRSKCFQLGQLADDVDSRPSYEETTRPSNNDTLSATQIKQTLIHMMTADCHLNMTLHGSHTVVRSDLEWYGPSLPHETILAVLSFFGVSEVWLSFFKAFLRAPTRFKEETATEPRTRVRGTPISYALSAFFGEAVLFIMDFAVNQKADGLYLYRIHDDLWFWDSDEGKCAAAWAAMGEYASLVGLKFNMSKTGSTSVETTVSGKLPPGDVRWGFLRFDSEEARFMIDQAEVDTHIVELRRQLNATKSIFGWVNAYNKYMAFFRRNFGGQPPACFGRALVDDMVNTFARIQRELFPDAESSGGAVGHLRKVISERFGMDGIPEGYFYFPIADGGLELLNPMIEVFALRSHDADNDPREAFLKEMGLDPGAYKVWKEKWEAAPSRSWSSGGPSEEFMSYEEYVAFREQMLPRWAKRYAELLDVPAPLHVYPTHALQNATRVLNSKLDYYGSWVVALYGEELLKKFGKLAVVDPNLIPVGMVQLFKTSRMRWEQ
ncbi:hypothetical protein HGRIS_006652 [Hohenbuehelia grisea]|uniref:Reverse transcriptase domain-containing protein n=1 Tax=Hohenbuehelia grisea TaxID=104357 RepID=A0ABR3JB58_9AGAR